MILIFTLIGSPGCGQKDSDEEKGQRGLLKDDLLQAVTSGVYPAPPARDLYLVTKDQFKGPAKEFIRWILNEGQKYVDEMGYIKLKEAQINEAMKRVGS